MEFPVVAKNDPTFCSDFCQPFVICRVLRKSELALWVIVIFDSKRRARRPDCLRKAFAEIAIKVERQ